MPYGYGHINFCDCICQFTADGKIIPLKIRVKDEDGCLQSYSIRGYKQLTDRDNSTSLPDGKFVAGTCLVYAIKVAILDTEKVLYLVYNPAWGKWYI